MKNELLEKMINSKKNLIVSGNIASGKTSRVIFPIVDSLINKKESIFVVDSKEEYINKYYDTLKNNNYNIVILNLRDIDKSESWNPFAYPYKLYKNGEQDKSQEYIEKVGRTLFYEDTKTNDPFWSITASDFMTGVTLGLFEDGLENEVNFNSVNNMFNGIDEKYGTKDYITEYFNLKSKASASYIHASTTILAPKDTKGSILSVARQKLRLYVSREKLSKFLNITSFKYEDITNKPTAIFFIGKDENKSLNSIVAMFIEQLYSYLFDNGLKVKMSFILDNLDTIEKVNNLSDMMSSCLSKGMKFIISTRSNDDLKEKYGSYIEKLADTLEIKNSSILLNINGEVLKEENNLMMDENYNFNINNNIEYPTLKDVKIDIFDLKTFVNDARKNVLINNTTNPFNIDPFGSEPFSNKDLVPFEGGGSNIDNLIKNIDKKLEELEQEEYKDIKTNINKSESELAKLKIDD